MENSESCLSFFRNIIHGQPTGPKYIVCTGNGKALYVKQLLNWQWQGPENIRLLLKNDLTIPILSDGWNLTIKFDVYICFVKAPCDFILIPMDFSPFYDIRK